MTKELVKILFGMSLVTFQYSRPITKPPRLQWPFPARPSYDTGRSFRVQAARYYRQVKSQGSSIILRTVPTSNSSQPEQRIFGPILSLDLGAKRIGAAVSDPTLVAITRLAAIPRSNWKQLLRDVRDLIRRFDAKTLVIGFPLSLDGNEGPAAKTARDIALKFARSLVLPVYLQDERLTSAEATERLLAAGLHGKALAAQLDGESAAIILRDFIDSGQQRMLIQRPLDQPPAD